MKRRYTWRPDLPDHRDHLLQANGAKRRPVRVDLRAGCSPVEDQGNLGSCTGNAWAGALEFLELKSGVPFVDISRLFIYYQERSIEGTVREDAGAEIRTGAKALAKVGACSEPVWPYQVKRFAVKPPADAYADAAKRRITEYLRCDGLAACLESLAEGFPVVFGFSVYSDFEGERVARTGVLNTPQPGERMLGGHAVLMVGYDDTTQRVLVRNSWGAKWGIRGYFTMPYGYIAHPGLADDFWTVRR